MMDMKKKRIGNIFGGLLLVAIILSMLGALTTSAQSVPVAASGALSLINLKVSPQPVVSGENITITFQLFNSYNNQLTNVNLALESSTQILNVSPTSAILVGSMGTGVYGGIGYSAFTYKIHVPSSLQAGEYTIDAIATYDTVSGATSYDLPAESVMPINIYVYGNPQISLTGSSNQQITPGLPFDLTISGLNTGTDKASNVSIELINSTQFSVIGPYKFNLGSINEGQSSSAELQLLPYSNISGGKHTLYFNVSYQSQTGNLINYNEKLPVNVGLQYPEVITSVSSANPQQIYPGSNQTLTLAIQNIGSDKANNVTITLHNSSGIKIGSSSDSFFVGSIGPGTVVYQNILIIANKNDSLSNYTLPVTLNYTSSNYQSKVSKGSNITINLEGSAIFNITSVKTNLQPGSTDQPITFKVTNTGNQQAQQVTLNLETTYPVTTVIPTAYISNLAPGESANVIFYVNIDTQGSPGSYPVTLYEQWRQPNGYTNQQFTSSQNYFAPVTSSSGNGGGSLLTYGIIIVVIIIAIVVIRRMMNKRKVVKKEKTAK